MDSLEPSLGKVIRQADVNARGTILFKSTQLLAYVDDIDIVERTTRDAQSTFIQIELGGDWREILGCTLMKTKSNNAQ